MKSFILIAVLAALTVCNDAASIPVEDIQFEDVATFQKIGEVYQKDYNLEAAIDRQLFPFLLFHEEYFHLPSIPYTVQIRDVVYLGNSTTEINRIRVFNPPHHPGHTSIINNVTVAHVRVRSGPGQGLLCLVQFFGYYTDSVIRPLGGN